MAKQSNYPDPQKHPHHYQYAAKFICTANLPGTSQTTDALLPGSYRTAVNIHNPHEEPAQFRMKLASPFVISDYFEFVLKPDGVRRVTCAHIDNFGIFPIHGFEGFLVIESHDSLDVVAVYTAGNPDVASIDVERVAERRLQPATD